jgi:hypothetical protein
VLPAGDYENIWRSHLLWGRSVASATGKKHVVKFSNRGVPTRGTSSIPLYHRHMKWLKNYQALLCIGYCACCIVGRSLLRIFSVKCYDDSRVTNRNSTKGIKVKVALGVPCRLRPRIMLTFGTTKVVGRQPYAPATFTPGKIPGTHFQRLSRPQGTLSEGTTEKIPSDTTGNRSGDRPTSSAAP